MNGRQKKKVIVQIAAVDVAWKEEKEKKQSLERQFIRFYFFNLVPTKVRVTFKCGH